jgi:hypothetical protein
MGYRRNLKKGCIHRYMRSTPNGQLKNVKLSNPESTDVCKYCNRTRLQNQEEVAKV